MVEQRPRKIILIYLLITLAAVIGITVAGVFLYKKYKPSQILQQTFLASAFNNIEQYADIFSNLKNSENQVNAEAGIVSHHFLAKQSIGEFYNKVSSDKISTVFLVSPDHFNNYFEPQSIAYTSKLNWTTLFGELDVNEEMIDSLIDYGIETKNSAMGLEHGIYVEIPFIKKFFPNAKIVPLVLKNNAQLDPFYVLGQEIKNKGTENSILIVSSDFSHDATIEQAVANDKKSIIALKNLATDNLGEITNDCKQCLAVLSGFLGNNQDSFYLTDNKNSFDISGQEGLVTSYVFGYYAKKDYAQILFVGDLMFDRGIRYYAEKNGGNSFIFEKISSVLGENDLVVANLEGPITDNKSVSASTAPGSANNYFFTFDPSVAKTLFEQNIRLVGLGNNHISNFGKDGEVATENYLDKENVDFFGAPNSNQTIIENFGDLKIGFVAHNQFALAEPMDVVNEITKLKQKTDLVFVVCHWGVEYFTEATEEQKTLAHQFIDAGADLIIGSHPHVIEPMEEYKGKRIYYSLGNFIFDQYFDENVRNGLGVVVKINKQTKQLEFQEKHFYLGSSGQTILAP